MRKNTLSPLSVLGFMGLVVMIHTFSAHAASDTIVCKTNFGEKSFVIENEKVTFNKEDESGIQRSISSISGSSVRTHKKHLGFSKTLYVDGLKHRINVQNVSEFSDVNDYLTITSPKGHEMTYPLSCHSV